MKKTTSICITDYQWLFAKEEKLIDETIGMAEEFAENKHVEYMKYLWEMFYNCVDYEKKEAIKEFIIRYYQWVPRPNEYWLPLAGNEDIAVISNYGRIQFIVDWRNYEAGDYYRPSVNNCGYLVAFGTTLHRLVALTFIGDCPEGKEVDHINNVKFDNRKDNIQYLSRSENNRKKTPSKHNKCPIMQFTLQGDFIAIYASPTVAIRANGWKTHNNGGISHACKHGNQCKGYYWRRQNNC